MKILGWFRNDLKDLDEGKTADEEEIDSLVKQYNKKGTGKIPKTISKIKENMQSQKKERSEKKESQEDFGDITSDDISKKRRKKLWKYFYYFLAVLFIGIILQAIFTVLTSGPRKAKKSIPKTEILEGMDVEENDYFQSRVSSQISELSAELKRMKNEEKEKDAAAKAALLEEAKRNRILKEKLEVLQTKLEEEKKNKADRNISEIIEAKLAQIKESLVSTGGRPSPSEISHGIKPLPSTPKGDDILVEKSTPSEPLTKKEEIVLQKKVKHVAKAIQKEYEYSDIQIEVLPSSGKSADGKLSSEEEKPAPFHIMTGFAKAVLITGVDAPTFGAGKANPVPVILSANSNEIIANGFDANIQDCMLIGQAFGVMNTRRAEIEVTRISCNIEKDGELYKIEEGVKGWVYDENGIHGIKGRLVDSAGKILTKELAVGFLQGVATAFAQPEMTVQTVGGVPSNVFEVPNLQDASYRGAAQGTATALNSLSDYYTKLLDGVYPFISVRSGRKVTILFKGGEDLKMTKYSRVDVQGDKGRFGDDESVEIDIDGW